MNQQTEAEIRNIYDSRIDNALFTRIMAYFDSILTINSKYYFKCRNNSNELMEHFSLFHSERTNRVVPAGALDKNLDDVVVPIIRFTNDNVALITIQPGFTFPYRKENENWTNVEIRNETINRLEVLLFAQAQWFSDNHLKEI